MRWGRRPISVAVRVRKADGVWSVDYGNGMPEVCFHDRNVATAAAAAVAGREGRSVEVVGDEPGSGDRTAYDVLFRKLIAAKLETQSRERWRSRDSSL